MTHNNKNHSLEQTFKLDLLHESCRTEACISDEWVTVTMMVMMIHSSL